MAANSRITDIRVALTFPGNRKAKALRRSLGPSGLWALVELWIYCAGNEPDGALIGWTVEDVENAANWDGIPGEFVKNTVRIGLLDVLPGGGFEVHDWAENQPWIAGSGARSDAARKAISVRWERSKAADDTDRIHGEYGQNTGVIPPSLPSPSLPLLSEPNTPQAEPAGQMDLLPLALDSVPPKKRRGSISGTVESRFEQFWAVVKKRVEKKAALAEFKRLNPDDGLLMTMVSAMKIYSTAKELEFQKAPHRWIKGECWNDELPGSGGVPSVSNAWKGAEN